MSGSTVQEEFEPIPFDYGANRYTIPSEFPDSLLRLIPQHEICNFIQSANELLEKSSDIRHTTIIRRRVLRLMTLMGALLLLGVAFLIAQVIINPNSLSGPLGWIGILLIYLSVIVLVIFTCMIFQTENFLGAFSYFTPMIKKLIKEKAERFAKKNVRWVLATRIGYYNRKVEVYDQLYIYWVETPIQEKIVNIEIATGARFESSTAATNLPIQIAQPDSINQGV